MRETLGQAAKKLLTEPVGTEKTIEISVNDGLTGFPAGVPSRGVRTKHTQVQVKEETRKDGKKRKVVVELPKNAPVAAEEWK